MDQGLAPCTPLYLSKSLRRPCSYPGGCKLPALEAQELQQEELHAALVAAAPQEYLCPVSLDLITDPVITPSGVTYDR
jgi:hypothetical protein